MSEFDSALESLFPARTTSTEETMDVGEKLAGVLPEGTVVALFGELGAGKTHLVKGFCKAHGIDPSEVTSPTFTIVQEYDGREGPIYHVDLYRLESPDALYELGYERYFFSRAICFVEWPDNAIDLIPNDALRLRLEHEGETERLIDIIPQVDASA